MTKEGIRPSIRPRLPPATDCPPAPLQQEPLPDRGRVGTEFLRAGLDFQLAASNCLSGPFAILSTLAILLSFLSPIHY